MTHFKRCHQDQEIDQVKQHILSLIKANSVDLLEKYRHPIFLAGHYNYTYNDYLQGQFLSSNYQKH